MSRVLLVDDDRELTELMAEQLMIFAGYEASFADSLLSALQVASEEAAFDVLISDLHLPDADAPSVAEALGIPIKLAMTGSSCEADSKRLLAAGFAEVMIKPVSGKQLLEVLRRCL